MINNLDVGLRDEAKIFQLSGNNKLANLLEEISVKMTSGSLGGNNIASASAMSIGELNRFEKLEEMMQKVLTKMEESSTPRSEKCQ